MAGGCTIGRIIRRGAAPTHRRRHRKLNEWQLVSVWRAAAAAAVAGGVAVTLLLFSLSSLKYVALKQNGAAWHGNGRYRL